MTRISPFAQAYIRRRTTQRMQDACRIFKPGPYITVDGKTKRGAPTTRYEGVCRYWEVPAGQIVAVGDASTVISQAYLSVPYNAAVPQPDDEVIITASVDPVLVNSAVRILSMVKGGGLRASRVFKVEVMDSTKEAW